MSFFRPERSPASRAVLRVSPPVSELGGTGVLLVARFFVFSGRVLPPSDG